MRPWTTREELTAQVVALARLGRSARAIARATDVSRNTVRKLLAAHRRAREEEAQDALPHSPPRAPRPTKLDTWHGRIAELLESYPDITAQRVLEELAAAGYEGGYTAVKEHVRQVRPKAPPQPSLAAEQHGPAEMAESDWSPHVIEFTHAPRATVQVFAYTLTYSTRKHLALFERCDLYALMDGHVAAFERFGGAAHKCKYDNQKPVVLGWEGNQPIYNPRFLAFSAHYEFTPVACRPRRPNDKPRVERAFWELERSFLNGRSFRDLDDMRAQLAAWLCDVADLRPRKRRSERPRMELFACEQPLLAPLPRHPYDTARVVYRVCSIDGFVAWDGNRYAVPYEHVTDLLPVRVTQRELFVYAADLSCVARHELAPRSAGVDVGADSCHPRPCAQDRRGAADLDLLRRAYDGMGERARAFLDALCTQTPRLAAYQARRILLLRERYATDDVCAALEHARSYGALTHQAVERILAARAAPRRLAEYATEDLALRLARNLGERQTPPRDLTEYDRLPTAGGMPSTEAPCPDDPRPRTSTSSDSGEPSKSSG
jgi:transposase